MSSKKRPNPFKVLRLPTDALNVDIVEKGQELTDLSENEEERMVCRWAMERLLTNPTERLKYELFEIPRTRYENERWERFVRVNRKNPLVASALLEGARAPGIDDIDISALLSLIVRGLLRIERDDPGIAIRGSPFAPGNAVPPLEIQDVLFG